MKLSTALLAGSLTANLALAAALLFWTPGPPVPVDTRATNDSGAAPTAPVDAKVHRDGPASRIGAPKVWERLRGDDLTALVARLRAAGFPSAMTAAMVRELVDEQFASRRHATTAAGEQPFWKARTDSGVDPKAQLALSVLSREEDALVKQLVGPDDHAADESYVATVRRQFGHELAPEKLERIQALQTSYGELMMQASAKAQASGGAWLPDDWAKMQQLQAGMRADLAKVLTSDELFEYDLRNSGTAYQLHNDLAALNPTEAEYRALFPLYQARDTQTPMQMGPAAPEAMAARQAADQQMQDQIKAVLGPDRYAEFQQAKSYDYRQTAKVTERLDLPSAATSQVYAVQKDAEQRAQALYNDRTLSAADRTTQLASLSNDATTKISGVLGAPGLDAYRQYAGQWLQRLQPPSRNNSKSP